MFWLRFGRAYDSVYAIDFPDPEAVLRIGRETIQTSAKWFSL